MANQQEQTTRSRYPAQEVAEGQEHGYIGEDVDVYDQETGKTVGKGIAPWKASDGVDDPKAKSKVAGETGTLKSDDTAPDGDAAPVGGKSHR